MSAAALPHGGSFVIAREDVLRIKQELTENIGERVKISAVKGRKRIVVRYGVILSTYRSIFTVTLESISEFAESDRTVSFNYSDLLTRAIGIHVIRTGKEIL